MAQTLGCSWMFEGGLGSQPLLRHFSAGEETSGSGVAMELGLQMTVFGWGPPDVAHDPKSTISRGSFHLEN